MAQVQINVGAVNRFLNVTVQPYLLLKAREIADEARRNAPMGATGELKGSINIDRGVRGSVVIRVDAPHAGFVHQGTGPQHISGPRGAYFPRLRKRGLILWSDSKGLNPYQVARGIAQRGTPPNPFLADAIEKVLGRSHFRWISRELKEV